MDVHSNAAAPLQDDFLLCESMEEGDGVSLEWLSLFVEECLSEQPPLPTPPPTSTTTTTTTTTNNNNQHAQSQSPSPFQGPKPISVPSKARTKRRKVNSRHAFLMGPTDPPLLPQAYWLADSELILPKKEEQPKELQRTAEGEKKKKKKKRGEGKMGPNGPGFGLVGQGFKKRVEEQMRRCTHCLSHKTPQWRAGPLGPKTLCNACGVRFKSGRLLPEYRPAKSPTFESYRHSNSHKKVMEMRMEMGMGMDILPPSSSSHSN